MPKPIGEISLISCGLRLTPLLPFCSAVTPNSKVPWESLAKWSGTALIIAGLIQLFNLLLHTLPMLVDLSTPEVVRDVTLASAGIVAVIGLLGFVPRLQEAAPRLARAGTIVAVLGLIGQFAIAVGEPLIGGETPPTWFLPFFLFHWILLPVSFLLFGTAGFRTPTPSRSVGSILVLIFISFLFFHHIIPLHVDGLLAQIPSLVIGGGLIASGYLHHTEGTPDGSAEPSGEPATR